MRLTHGIVGPPFEREARDQRDTGKQPRPRRASRRQDRQYGERDRMHQRGAQMPEPVDGPDGSAPAQFVRDKPREARLDAGMPYRERRNRNRGAGAPHRVADRMILRQMMGELCESADALEHRALHCDGLAKTGTRSPNRETCHDPGQEMIVRRRCGKARPPAWCAQSSIYAGHESHAGALQRADDVPQVTALHGHVAVGEAQHIMPCVLEHVDQIADFAIRPVEPGVDHHANLRIRIACAQTVDGRECDIRGVMHPKHELDRARIILLEKTDEIVLEIPLVAAQWLDERHAGEARRLRAGTRKEAAHEFAGQPRVTDSRHSKRGTEAGQ
jgi:hypothetical protein